MIHTRKQFVELFETMPCLNCLVAMLCLSVSGVKIGEGITSIHASVLVWSSCKSYEKWGVKMKDGWKSFNVKEQVELVNLFDKKIVNLFFQEKR